MVQSQRVGFPTLFLSGQVTSSKVRRLPGPINGVGHPSPSRVQPGPQNKGHSLMVLCNPCDGTRLLALQMRKLRPGWGGSLPGTHRV